MRTKDHSIVLTFVDEYFAEQLGER
jgi:hypothetical protein